MLAREVGALLDLHTGALIVDCTFCAGGHSRLLARELEGSGELVAIDRDPTTQPFVAALRARVGRPRPRLQNAQLTKAIVIAGLRDRLEIWDREAWRRQLAEVEGSAESVAERLAQSKP